MKVRFPNAKDIAVKSIEPAEKGSVRLHKATFVLSAFLVVLGLFAGLQIERGKANLGVELSGGAIIRFKAEKDFKLDQIRSALSQSRITDYELQEVPGQRVLMVRVKNTGTSEGTISDQVAGALSNHLPDNRFSLESKSEIGASVSHDLKKAAITAIAISLAEYSLTDTVVVFDRIRENLKMQRNPNLRHIINQSINQVLSRTIITSGTVVLVLVALITMGGVLLQDFALALLIGVAVGTYFSIFVASPIIYIWENLGSKTQKYKKQNEAHDG